jgi:hypothetical protein
MTSGKMTLGQLSRRLGQEVKVLTEVYHPQGELCRGGDGSLYVCTGISGEDANVGQGDVIQVLRTGKKYQIF